MLLTVKTARFLLVFFLVAASLSTAYLVHGRDHCADEECNFPVTERKVMQTIRSKMASDDYSLMKMEMMKEKFERSKYTRKSRMMMPKENYRASFVAFNADYKGPRRHPPKNN
ncbi:protein GOLVEN 5-like [Salvia hispanica]|uniref:protein GOLVEN 5-like n=1 Tax=Salvia hispanica TaxID=49212 RepID=UPI0020093D14|nr:protein GOLVEN 5-like [Salvia hispanica]XP_047957523.1 protein GOLVEN 5-like [Salvia hispanica]